MLELYDNLMALTERDKTKFFFRDTVSVFDTRFRIFSYHIASYTDWCEDDAMECRGIMFEMDDNGPVRIASRPMEKFFNLGECPFTIGLDLNTTTRILAKEDGSLISTFIDNGRLGLKSKTSIHSAQANEAMAWLRHPDRLDLYELLTDMATAGYTCNLEYVSPTNRIVLDYKEKALVVLNVRENESGTYVPYQELFKGPVLRKYLVEGFVFDEIDDAFIESIRAQEGVEGYIFELASGQKFKLKTRWYSALHHTKDSINNNNRLFEAIVAGASDDLKGMFATDQHALTKVEAFEEVYRNYLSESLQIIEGLYSSIKGKDRKDYAVTAQVALKHNPGLFSIVMNAYSKGINYDTIVDQINNVFTRNCKSLVPSEYIEEKIIFGE